MAVEAESEKDEESRTIREVKDSETGGEWRDGDRRMEMDEREMRAINRELERD